MITSLLLYVSMLADTQSYSIDVGRKIKAYDEYTQRSVHELVMFQAVGKDTMKVHESVVVFNADTKVVNVTADGQEARKTLKVIDFYVFGGKDTVHLLPADTELRAEVTNAGTTYMIGSKPVADSIQPYLDRVVRGEGGTQTGTIMNPSKPVRLNEHWHMNTKALQKMLPEIKSVKNLKNDVVLEYVDTLSSPKSAMVSSAMSFTTSATSPDGRKPGTTAVETRISVIVPLDSRYPPLARGTDEHIVTTYQESKNRKVSQILHSSLRSSFGR